MWHQHVSARGFHQCHHKAHKEHLVVNMVVKVSMHKPSNSKQCLNRQENSDRMSHFSTKIPTACSAALCTKIPHRQAKQISRSGKYQTLIRRLLRHLENSAWKCVSSPIYGPNTVDDPGESSKPKRVDLTITFFFRLFPLSVQLQVVLAEILTTDFSIGTELKMWQHFCLFRKKKPRTSRAR